MPFEQVMERLADAHQLNIIVNWNDLKRAGVPRDVLIHLDLPGEITLKKVLTEVLTQAGVDVDLGFEVADGLSAHPSVCIALLADILHNPRGNR